ncbi:MAG: acyltransferase [Flavobacteriales bacterium]|nr:acyltransferase [Flavobacteriales bacterium]
MVPNHYPALTGIRALASCMVFLHHHGTNVAALQHPLAQAIVGQMFTGVVFFFVLSGFLIADRYYDTARMGFRNYFMRRFFRVVPLYALLTTLTFIVSWVLGDARFRALFFEFVVNLTFLRGWSAELWDTGILQGWSLTAEMTFYLLAPLLFLSIQWRRWMLVVLPIGFVAIGVLLVFGCQGKAPLGFMGSFDLLFGITFFGRCSEFFVGVALALFLRRKGMWTFQHATLIGCILCMAAMCGTAYLDVDYRHASGVLLLNLLLPIGVGIFYWGLLTERTVIRSILSSAVAQFMGRTSYAFYLIHLGVVFTAVYMSTENLVLSFLLLQGTAWLLYRSVEEPIARWSRRRFPMDQELRSSVRTTN